MFFCSLLESSLAKTYLSFAFFWGVMLVMRNANEYKLLEKSPENIYICILKMSAAEMWSSAKQCLRFQVLKNSVQSEAYDIESKSKTEKQYKTSYDYNINGFTCKPIGSNVGSFHILSDTDVKVKRNNLGNPVSTLKNEFPTSLLTATAVSSSAAGCLGNRAVLENLTIKNLLNSILNNSNKVPPFITETLADNFLLSKTLNYNLLEYVDLMIQDPECLNLEKRIYNWKSDPEWLFRKLLHYKLFHLDPKKSRNLSTSHFKLLKETEIAEYKNNPDYVMCQSFDIGNLLTARHRKFRKNKMKLPQTEFDLAERDNLLNNMIFPSSMEEGFQYFWIPDLTAAPTKTAYEILQRMLIKDRANCKALGLDFDRFALLPQNVKESVCRKDDKGCFENIVVHFIQITREKNIGNIQCDRYNDPKCIITNIHDLNAKLDCSALKKIQCDSKSQRQCALAVSNNCKSSFIHPKFRLDEDPISFEIKKKEEQKQLTKKSDTYHIFELIVSYENPDILGMTQIIFHNTTKRSNENFVTLNEELNLVQQQQRNLEFVAQNMKNGTFTYKSIYDIPCYTEGSLNDSESPRLIRPGDVFCVKSKRGKNLYFENGSDNLYRITATEVNPNSQNRYIEIKKNGLTMLFKKSVSLDDTYKVNSSFMPYRLNAFPSYYPQLAAAICAKTTENKSVVLRGGDGGYWDNQSLVSNISQLCQNKEQLNILSFDNNMQFAIINNKELSATGKQLPTIEDLQEWNITLKFVKYAHVITFSKEFKNKVMYSKNDEKKVDLLYWFTDKLSSGKLEIKEEVLIPSNSEFRNITSGFKILDVDRSNSTMTVDVAGTRKYVEIPLQWHMETAKHFIDTQRNTKTNDDPVNIEGSSPFGIQTIPAIFDGKVEDAVNKIVTLPEGGAAVYWKCTTLSRNDLKITGGQTVRWIQVSTTLIGDIQMVYSEYQLGLKSEDGNWETHIDRCKKNAHFICEKINQDKDFYTKPTSIALPGGGYIAAMIVVPSLQKVSEFFGIAGSSENGVKYISGNSGGTWGTILYFAKPDFTYKDFEKMILRYDQYTTRCQLENPIVGHQKMILAFQIIKALLPDTSCIFKMGVEIGNVNFDWTKFVLETMKPTIDLEVRGWEIFPTEVCIIMSGCILKSGWTTMLESKSCVK